MTCMHVFMLVHADPHDAADTRICVNPSSVCPSQQNKDKDESERERDKDDEKLPAMAAKPTGAKRGRPQIRTTPSGLAGRSVSKTPSNEGRSNGRSSRTETPSSIANGDSKTH